MVAERLGRNCIGIELNRNNKELILKRLREDRVKCERKK